jgi:hypothetical protein
MILQQFLTVVAWALFAALMVAAVGLAIPKIFVLAVDPQIWLWSWTGGAVAVGLLTAAIWTWCIRRSELDAAIEIDRRFGLKERVSSVLSLHAEERASEVGQALVGDAIRRVERIDVREHFKVAPNWRLLLPLLPAVAVVGLAFLPNAALKQATATTEVPVEIQKQVKAAAEKLQEKLREAEKRSEELGLKDAELLKEINKEVDKLAKRDSLDRKDALIKLNDLAKDVEKRKQELGGARALKKNLDKLKNIEKGPGDKMNDALKEGDFGKAKEALEQLKEDLQAGKLKAEDKKQLAKQLEQMKQALEERAQAQQEAKEDLKHQIQQKMQEGNLAEAGKLQQQLNELEQNGDQMQQAMQKLADKLGQCSKCLNEGGDKQAMDQLDKLAGDLNELQDQLDQMENLDELLDQLADAKNAMRCENCGGAGCKECQGDADKMGKGMGKGKGKGRGDGLGEGQGQGDRPEEETDKSFYDSRVAADPKAGESVRIGDAGGKNLPGKSLETVKAEVRAAINKEPESLNDQTLPRDQRENARQFFEKFRKGE